MIAAVRAVIAASRRSRSRLRVRACTSTNTGVAPTASATFALATQLSGDVITSSPGPMPQTRSASSNAAVPELTSLTGRPPKRADKAASNCWHLGPVVIQPERSTAATSLIVASSIEGRVKGRNAAELTTDSRCGPPARRRR